VIVSGTADGRIEVCFPLTLSGAARSSHPLFRRSCGRTTRSDRSVSCLATAARSCRLQCVAICWCQPAPTTHYG
jgi:hypothetical protein